MQPWKSLSANVQLGTQTEGWNLAIPPAESADELRVFRFTIYFEEPFAAPPLVHLGLSGFDFDQRHSNRLTVTPVEITSESFVAEIVTWRDTLVYSAGFSWLALGA